MKTVFFTPGPSQLYPTVVSHFKQAFMDNIASISHRSKSYEQIYQETVSGISQMFNIPKNYYIFFVSSGTEAMERTIQNCVEEYSFHFVNGAFSKRFFTIAQALGKNPQKFESAIGVGFDFNNTPIPQNTELICLTHNETSSGVMLAAREIYEISHKHREHGVLIALDIVSSVPIVDLDFSLLDVVFFSVQKGFGLPAGLGVMIVSPAAMQKAEILSRKGIIVGSYHSFINLKKFAQKNQNPETPPVLEIYILNHVIKDMLEVGIEKIRRQSAEKAEMIYDFLDNHQQFSAFVKDHKSRSQTVIVADVGVNQPQIMQYLESLGFIMGNGYGSCKSTQIRIANFPSHTIEHIKNLLQALSYI